MKIEEALKVIAKQDNLLKAINEVHSLEPLDDESGTPAYNDYDEWQKIANRYGLDYYMFLDHMNWLGSNGLVGKPYAK